MTIKAAKHYSHSYELKLDKLPTKKSDRMALRIMYPGILVGLIFMAVGLADILTRGKGGFNFDGIILSEATKHVPLISPDFFDGAIILLGLWIIASLLVSYIRYKKVFFDGKSVTIVQRPAIGKKQSFKEDIKKYDGVMLRIEFFQLGFLTRRRYIVELANKNINKVAPLYISVSSKNLRQIWKSYAKRLNLPALFLTDEAVTSRDVEDLDKSIIDLVKKKKLKNKFDKKAPLPESIAYTRKNDKTIVKSRRIRWDAFNIIYWLLLIMVAVLMTLTFYTSDTLREDFFEEVMALVIAFVLLYVFFYARKEKIVLKKYKIIVVQKFMLFSRKKNEVMKKNVEAIEVGFNPVTNRHFLVLSSANKEIIFGEKLPAEELKWVRDFLINELVK